MKKEVNSQFALGFIIILAIIVGGYTILECYRFSIPSFPPIVLPSWPFTPELDGIKKFSSQEDFKSYLEKAEFGYLYGLGGTIGMARALEETSIAAPLGPFEGDKIAPERISETTVQVLGIDEPDIVKTDGKEIYFSSTGFYWRRFLSPETIIPQQKMGETKVIKAFPPADLAIESEIDKTGDLLLKDNILIIFSNDKILGFDISNPKSPEKKWTIELENNTFVAGARLYKGRVYLITKTRIDSYRPCPIRPLSIEGVSLEIKCVDIYHPIVPVPIDITYNALIFEPNSGKVEETVSFVGSSSQSILYMSNKGIYVTYSYYGDFIKFFSNFFKEKCQDIIPAWLSEKMEKLSEYDISDTAKLAEFQIILQKYQNSLSDDEELRIQNELSNRIEDYYREHKRDLEKTGIIKIGLDEFEILATGNVPGRPLNQFALDEYKDNLRIAVTVGETFWGMGTISGMGESANDVYVLDEALKTIGSVKDLGLTERIYSARFVEDKGYLVTFKQIDPFFVIDLSDSKKPELKGELKIPGYSSYLHPITKDKILGIGKEGSKVKISLFNVENPENPTEIAKYTLDEYWSDVLNTHHAFLLDKKHQIFFLPGSRGGYIFSYENNQLALTKAVSNITAKRAVYMDDYLYIIGENKVTVLNEIDWEKVNELEL